MFKFVALFIAILACIQLAFGSNIHHGTSLAPASTIISGQYGHGAHANSIVSRNLAVSAVPVISSYSTSIVHPDTVILRPAVRSYIPTHQQYISAPLTQQIHSSPFVSQGIYGQNVLNTNSYAVQRSYTGPLAVSGNSARGIYSSPILASAHGSPLIQAISGISAHRSAW